MQWISEKLHGRGMDRANDALSATTDVINKSRSIRQQLEPYRLDQDPFASIVRWSQISKSVNDHEVRGGPFK